MRFTVAGSRILCSRKDNTAADGDCHRHVVSFDAHVDRVPPHVAAKLTRGEIEELESFLVDRKRIQANPVQVNMLEALPDLLDEAATELDAAGQLTEGLYRKLVSSVRRLSRVLDSVKPRSDSERKVVRNMRGSEVLKERLEDLKRNL
ncbi:MAG: hypothetical protein PVF80_11710 [Gammaproteobacteria bacterium]